MAKVAKSKADQPKVASKSKKKSKETVSNSDSEKMPKAAAKKGATKTRGVEKKKKLVDNISANETDRSGIQMPQREVFQHTCSLPMINVIL